MLIYPGWPFQVLQELKETDRSSVHATASQDLSVYVYWGPNNRIQSFNLKTCDSLISVINIVSICEGFSSLVSMQRVVFQDGIQERTIQYSRMKSALMIEHLAQIFSWY